MRTIGNRRYNLLFIDSNVISEIVHNGNINSSDFFNYSLENNAIVCFSFYNILEIRNGYKERWEKFLEFFSMFPCAVIKPYWQIILDEVDSYDKESGELYHELYPIFNHFSALGKNSTYHFKKWIDEVLDLAKDSLKYEQTIFMKTMNYFNSRRDLSEERVKKEFAKRMQIEKLDPMLMKKSTSNRLFENMKLPSINVLFYSFFHRYAYLKRELKISDINDIAISACTPYIDAIITEKYQSQVLLEILHKMKLSEIKIFKVSSFFIGKDFPAIVTDK
ncbi:hypothetical protein [Enterococcus gallinarum]|uniref:hypothetical protein n=1 Tax=Enterococcus gallinarum TaxID=1353 RepID=UPI0018AC232C|nr:hypothetical protein [Enterococcus gallinarum]